MKISSWATPEGLAGHSLSTTDLNQQLWSSKLLESTKYGIAFNKTLTLK